jgi:Fe-S-cluster containining protein
MRAISLDRTDLQTEKAVFLLDESADFDEQLCRNTARVCLNITIFGKELNLTIGFLDVPVRVCDIIPVAQAICDKIINATLSSTKNLGLHIPCKKGCSLCCKNLVPLSDPEALWLNEEISRMPIYEQKVLHRSIEFARRKLLATQPPDFSEKNSKQDISNWYAGLNLTCPFLAENVCDIYKSRPLACREHIVTGIRHCNGANTTQNTQILKPPVSVLEAVAQLYAELEKDHIDAIMLPIMVEWAESVKNTEPKTYYMSHLLGRLVEILEQQAGKS